MYFYLQYFLSPSLSFAIILPLGFPTCSFYVQFSPNNRKNVAGSDVSLDSPLFLLIRTALRRRGIIVRRLWNVGGML